MKNEIKSFIISQIESLSDRFYNISFKYGYDDLARQHIIEVDPESEYKNEEYMLAEADVVEAFIDKFPSDDLLFVSNDKYIKVKTPIFVKEAFVFKYTFPVLSGITNEKVSLQYLTLPLVNFPILNDWSIPTAVTLPLVNLPILNDWTIPVNAMDHSMLINFFNWNAILPNIEPISNEPEFSLAA